MFPKIIKILLYLTALAPLIVWDKYLYPFVSVRAVFFRFIIEIALIVFLILLFNGKIKTNKLKGNYIFFALAAFIFISTLSALFGFSPANSFFSTIERSWGIFTLAHLFAFYFLIRTFFSKKDWLIYIKISVAVSAIVGILGIFQYYNGLLGLEAGNRIGSTLGNAAYLAIYLVFNIFFAAYFLIRGSTQIEHADKTPIHLQRTQINVEKQFYKLLPTSYKLVYGAVILINLFALSLTGTRGTYLGLIVGLALAGFLYIFLGQKKKYKSAITISFIVLAALSFFVFSNRSSTLIKNTPVLNRISTISFSESTVATRLIGWRAAWKGFLDRPLLGSGPENFNVVFNKYITADYYTYAPTEPYFDRAHNNFLDVLATIGIFGLAAYLGFFFYIFYFLFKGHKEQKLNLREFLLFFVLLTSYLIHIFFVFDDLNSFLLLLVLAGFVEFLYAQDNLIGISDLAVKSVEDKYSELRKVSAAILILLILWIGYSFNVKIIRAARITTKGLITEDKFDAAAYFSKALDLNIVSNRDIVFVYADTMSGLTKEYRLFAKDDKKKMIFENHFDKVEEALKAEIKKNSYDALLYARLAGLYNLKFIAFEDIQYTDLAVSNINKAISFSQNRPQYYHFLSDIYNASGQNEKAIEAARRALEMNEKYRASWFFLSRAYLFAGRLDESLKYLESSIGAGYNPTKQTFLILAKRYLAVNNAEKAIEVYELFIGRNPDDASILAKMTILYLRIGENQKAIDSARKSAELNPNLKNEVDYIIQKIREGKGEELLKQLE